MSIESHSPSDESRLPAAVARTCAPRHGSSRMLENYLRDIEQLMRERLWVRAAQLALALPHICAALASTDLVSSREAYLEWCETWVRPTLADASIFVPSPDALSDLAEAHGVEPQLSRWAGVPARALRQLRLRRLSRAAPPRARGAFVDVSAPSDEPEAEACMALLDAARRWYGDWAADAPVVQTNLARLAVLR